MIDTVIFDMDGVIFDTEQIWHTVRRDFATRQRGHWTEADQASVMGANSQQWSTYMREKCGVNLPPDEIFAEVLRELERRFRSNLPIYPGAREAVAQLAGRYRLGIASSSPRQLIETALEVSGMRRFFLALVSSDEVAHGKPEPDVYLLACAKLGAEPRRSAAIEDSANGIRAAAAAGLAVIAIPNEEFPPPADAVSLAVRVLTSISELSVVVVDSLDDR
ncbi:MAG: HAD family phosphatase [Actinobacteria bacterium]|nr:HAD family phosphatase [Actinomycetota bacterium]